MTHTEIACLVIAGVLICMDYATGLIKACMQRDISSTRMREGLYHKGAFVIALTLAGFIDHAQHALDMGFALPLLPAAAGYVALTEIASIVENLGEINPELQGTRLLQLFRTTNEGKESQ